MDARDLIGAEDVARAALEVANHGRAASLGAFAFDILSRQAEGRALFAGKKHVETRAEEHGIERSDADTARGNLLEILTRGPETASERALVAAFAVAGLRSRLKEDDDAVALTRFVRQADWLEAATPYVVYAFVDRVLGEEDATRVWNAVADACVSARPGAVDHEARGTAALRVAALDAAESEAAADALARVAHHASDSAVRAAAAFALGDDGASGAPSAHGAVAAPGARMVGHQGRARGGLVREALRVATGWALLAWLLRLVLALLGVERPVEVSVVPGGIELRRRVMFLGRVVREGVDVVPFTGLARLSRDVRYPALHLLVGLSALSLGILFGGALAVDALRSGATWLFLVGATVVLLGAGLDLVLDVLVPARRRRVAIELAPIAGPARRIEGVTVEAADRFLEAVKKQL